MGEISKALQRARESESAEAESASPPPANAPSELAKIRAHEAAEDAARAPAAAPSNPAAAPAPPPEPPAASEPDPPPVERAPREMPVSDALRAARGEEPAPNSDRRSNAERFHSLLAHQPETQLTRAVLTDPSGAMATRLRHLAVRVRRELDFRTPSSLLVTSAISGEGKTLVSINLGIALAAIASERRIALVDLDFYRSRFCEALGYQADVGMEAVLSRGERDVELENVAVRTDVAGLDLFPIARLQGSGHDLLGGEQAGVVLRKLADRYDYVIIDGPPVLPVPDVPLIASQVGGVLAIARSGSTRRRLFREMVSLLPSRALIGTILNDTQQSTGASGYGYGYGYGADDDRNEAEDGARPAGYDRREGTP